MNHKDHRNRKNILFVCSRNRWRSPTAEMVYRDDPRISTRSRGTSANAAKTLEAKDIHWSDAIMVMERSHRHQIRSLYGLELGDTSVHVLDIPDDYRFMDPELIQMIQWAVEPLLEKIL